MNNIENLRMRAAALVKSPKWQVMQDLLDAGVIREECVEEYKILILAEKKREAE